MLLQFEGGTRYVTALGAVAAPAWWITALQAFTKKKKKKILQQTNREGGFLTIDKGHL